MIRLVVTWEIPDDMSAAVGEWFRREPVSALGSLPIEHKRPIAVMATKLRSLADLPSMVAAIEGYHDWNVYPVWQSDESFWMLKHEVCGWESNLQDKRREIADVHNWMANHQCPDVI